MTDWPDLRPPCADNPDGWEVPRPIVTDHAARIAYQRVAEAVWACRTCPALRPCAEWAVLKPPQDAVQAGMVWGLDRQPRQLQHWRGNVVNKLAYHRRRRALA